VRGRTAGVTKQFDPFTSLPRSLQPTKAPSWQPSKPTSQRLRGRPAGQHRRPYGGAAAVRPRRRWQPHQAVAEKLVPPDEEAAVEDLAVVMVGSPIGVVVLG
jgi:hypothetical protein